MGRVKKRRSRISKSALVVGLSRRPATGPKLLSDRETIYRRRAHISTTSYVPRINSRPFYLHTPMSVVQKEYVQQPRRVAARAVALLKKDNLKVVASTATNVCSMRQTRRRIMHANGKAGGPTRPPTFTQRSLIKCRRKK